MRIRGEEELYSILSLILISGTNSIDKKWLAAIWLWLETWLSEYWASGFIRQNIAKTVLKQLINFELKPRLHSPRQEDDEDRLLGNCYNNNNKQGQSNSSGCGFYRSSLPKLAERGVIGTVSSPAIFVAYWTEWTSLCNIRMTWSKFLESHSMSTRTSA